MRKRFEVEFLRLAADMLRCRFHVVNGRNCTVSASVQYTGLPADHVMCFVGYGDFKGEMRIMCRQKRAEAVR